MRVIRNGMEECMRVGDSARAGFELFGESDEVIREELSDN